MRIDKVTTSRNKKNYWDYITGFLCDLLSISKEEYLSEMKSTTIEEYSLAAAEYRRIVQNTV